MATQWTIRVCRLCGRQECDGHCRPNDYADPEQIAVVPESALREAEERAKRWKQEAWDCFVEAGGDTDGDKEPHGTFNARLAVKELRREYEAAMEREALKHDPDGVDGLRVRLAEAQAAADALRPILREAEEREAVLAWALGEIVRLPCAHPDDPDEHKKMALDLVKAQEIAHAALDASEEA